MYVAHVCVLVVVCHGCRVCLSECGVFVHNVFEHLLDSLPLRIKPVLRNMIVPMVISCPSDQWCPSLLPILTRVFYITFSVSLERE